MKKPQPEPVTRTFSITFDPDHHWSSDYQKAAELAAEVLELANAYGRSRRMAGFGIRLSDNVVGAASMLREGAKALIEICERARESEIENRPGPRDVCCTKCNGRGWTAPVRVVCGDCDGSGDCPACDGGGIDPESAECDECDVCGGDGMCETCEGTGYVD